MISEAKFQEQHFSQPEIDEDEEKEAEELVLHSWALPMILDDTAKRWVVKLYSEKHLESIFGFNQTEFIRGAQFTMILRVKWDMEYHNLFVQLERLRLSKPNLLPMLLKIGKSVDFSSNLDKTLPRGIPVVVILFTFWNGVV